MKIRISHILVKHAYEAEDILKLLKEGKDFATLATKFSSCASKEQGGDLGVHGVHNRLDEDFSDAAFLLKSGQYSAKPVRTRFGYHIILRTE